MRRHVFLSLLLLGVLCVTGCSSESPETLVKEIIHNIEEMNEILSEVNDAPSAKAAAPRLKKLMNQWHKIEQQLVAMDEPDEATKQRVHELYEDHVADLVIVLMEHVMRLNQQPGAMEELADALPFTDL